MLAKMKMGKKIGLGFTCVLVPLIIVALVAWSALSNAAGGFATYRELARNSNLGGEVQAHMLMVRMKAKDFMIRGDTKEIEGYNGYYTKMVDDLEQARERVTNPERLAKLDEVAAAVKDYNKGFDQVVGLMAKRNDAVYGVLAKEGGLMSENLSAIMDSAQAEGKADVALEAGTALRSLLLGRLYVAKFLDTNDQASVDRVAQEWANIQKRIETLDGQLTDPGRKEQLAAVVKAMASYEAGFQDVVDAISQRNDIIKDTLDHLGPMIAQKVEDVKLSIKAEQDELGPALQASNRRSVSVVVMVSAGAVIFGVVVSLVLAAKLTSPIRKAVDMLKDVAQGEGDLTKRLEVTTQDEIGEMANWFNLFVDKLQRLIADIGGNAQTMASAATELLANAGQMSTTAQRTTERSASVASGAEQMSANMKNMAASSEEMTSNIKTVASAVEEMTASISEVAKNAEKAAGVAGQASSLAESSNDRISQLGVAADEIGKVIEVIQDIAEQTNLLALNATIEAARAGDAGKGFAVVATEVKELAKQTGDATEDIRKRIEAIQGSTGDAVQSIGEIREVINDVNEVSRTIASAVEEQSITTKEIAANVAQTAQASDSVASGVAESASASQEITENITQVDEDAQQTAQGAASTKTAGEQVAELAEGLRSLVGQFRV